MTIRLPELFLDKMRPLLGDAFEAWLASYEEARWYGLRVNALKLSEQDFLALSPIAERLQPIPWASGAYYYGQEDRPGRHPHYHAGLYYIQEPSAMAPAELLDVRPGHRVLDLCAAPGGKSTQLASKLRGEGLLVSNDNAGERTKALARNIELAGVRNVIVLNEEPARIAARFPSYFDRVLVDAPCSGEGMFRKDDSMIAQWEKHSVERCADMQRDILLHAAELVAPGGLLVYSTCTFSPEENEAQIARLLAARPDYAIVPIALANGWAPGLASWPGMEESEAAAESLTGTARLWPHRVKGEGHYVAVLKRAGEPAGVKASGGRARLGELEPESAGASLAMARKPDKRNDHGKRQDRPHKRAGSERQGRGVGSGKPAAPEGDAAIAAWRMFAQRELPGADAWPGRLLAYGSRVYLQPAGVPSLDGLRVVRAGWYLGEAGASRFEPSQPLAMGLTKEATARTVDLASTGEDAAKYLKGETLVVEAARIEVRSADEGAGRDPAGMPARGLVLVCIDGYPVGWGRWDNGMLKNGLAPGWRRI